MKCPTCGANDPDDLELDLTPDEVRHVLEVHNCQEVSASWVRRLAREYLKLRAFIDTGRDRTQ